MKFKSEILVRFSVALLFILSFTSCKKDFDSTPPGPVTDLQAKAGNGQVILEWTEPDDPDLFEIEVEVTFSPGSTTMLTQSAGTNGMIISGLQNGTQYNFAVVTVDETNLKSNAVHVTAIPNQPFQVVSPDQENYNPAGGTYSTDGNGHLIITVNFNRPVDPATVVPVQTIYFEGDDISQGTVAFTNGDRTITFTTTDEVTDFGTLSGDIHFDFLLIGDDTGNGAISDENGMILDGDEDGVEGGNYELNLYIIA
jgi:hypothetical protein